VAYCSTDCWRIDKVPSRLLDGLCQLSICDTWRVFSHWLFGFGLFRRKAHAHSAVRKLRSVPCSVLYCSGIYNHGRSGSKRMEIVGGMDPRDKESGFWLNLGLH
jgi:hypothetical protein